MTQGRPQRILIVDDDATLRGVLSELLEAPDRTIEVACGGLDGIERARSRPPDVILLDISLPDLDGFDVFRLISRDEDLRAARIILMTGHADGGALEMARDLGAFECLEKPFRAEVLEATVRLALANVHDREPETVRLSRAEANLDAPHAPERPPPVDAPSSLGPAAGASAGDAAFLILLTTTLTRGGLRRRLEAASGLPTLVVDGIAALLPLASRPHARAVVIAEPFGPASIALVVERLRGDGSRIPVIEITNREPDRTDVLPLRRLFHAGDVARVLAQAERVA